MEQHAKLLGLRTQSLFLRPASGFMSGFIKLIVPLALLDTPKNSTLDVVPCTSFGPKRYLPLNNTGASKVALAQHRPLLHLTGPLWASAFA